MLYVFIYICVFINFLWISFYAAEPVSLCWSFALEALIYTGTKISEFAVKGWQGNPETEFDVWDYMKPLTNVGWFQWIGAVIFFWGWIHQFHCHKILVGLCPCCSL